EVGAGVDAGVEVGDRERGGRRQFHRGRGGGLVGVGGGRRGVLLAGREGGGDGQGQQQDFGFHAHEGLRGKGARAGVGAAAPSRGRPPTIAPRRAQGRVSEVTLPGRRGCAAVAPSAQYAAPPE